MKRAMSSCLTFVAALVVPLAAQAQSSSEDIELARAIARKGWFDVAEEILAKVNQGGNATAKAMVPYVHAEIQLEKADRESDVEKSKAGMSEAVSQLRKFLEANPTHPLAQEARVTIGWVQARMGRLLVDAAASADTADKRDEHLKGALKAYTDAEKFYQETINDLKANIDKIKDIKDPTREKYQDSLMDARLELPRVMIEHARISGIDEPSRKKLLEEAKRQLVDFEFDYGDRPIAFEAMLEEGKCLTDIADYKQAESRLKATLSLRQSLAAARIKPNEYHLKIINGAHIAIAQMFIKAGKLAEARAYVDTVLKEDRSLEKDPAGAGNALKLEKADALFRLKDASGAAAIANEVIKADPNGVWGYRAGQKIKSWGNMAGGSGGIKMPPDQLLKAAEAAEQRGQDREALVNLRKCIEACTTDAERKEFLPKAYFKMGSVYQELRRNYEAAIAYEQVLTLFPEHALAAKACYEAGRCYSLEFEISKDKKDDELKEKFLSILAQRWPKDPVARNIRYMQAEKVEKAGDLKKAAELYLQVGEDAEAYENALVAAGYCLHIDAVKKWEKASKDATVQQEVKTALRMAEEALRKFLARVADQNTAPKQENLIKARENLKLVANQELAYILMHEAVGKTEEALKFLEEVAKTIPAGDDRIAKIWSTQIQAYLAQKKVDQAIKVLDMMLEKFPDAPALARACKSVAIKLDEATADLEKSNGDQTTINNNLKKISRYYAKWLQLAPALGMKITMLDVINVAETLYRIAKLLNGLDKDVVSFMDLNGKPIGERQYFSDAAMVLTLLVDGKVTGAKLPDKEKIMLMTRLARCESFLATDASSWEKANQAYEAIVKAYKVVDNRGLIDVNVVSAHKELLGVYSEQGYVYYELGKRGQKFQLDNATTVFSNLLRVLPQGSQDWWQSKYMVFTVLFERGKESDLRDAKAGISNLELNFPNFDEGKFGMKAKLMELKGKIQQVSGGK